MEYGFFSNTVRFRLQVMSCFLWVMVWISLLRPFYTGLDLSCAGVAQGLDKVLYLHGFYCLKIVRNQTIRMPGHCTTLDWDSFLGQNPETEKKSSDHVSCVSIASWSPSHLCNILGWCLFSKSYVVAVIIFGFVLCSEFLVIYSGRIGQ